MAYPHDLPASGLSVWGSSGNYTPGNVCRYIRDGYTPVNKISMQNSLGVEIASVQNFVNKWYLGRENDRVGVGYFGTCKAYSGLFAGDEAFTRINQEGVWIDAGTGGPYSNLTYQELTIDENDSFVSHSSIVSSSGFFASQVFNAGPSDDYSCALSVSGLHFTHTDDDTVGIYASNGRLYLDSEIIMAEDLPQIDPSIAGALWISGSFVVISSG